MNEDYSKIKKVLEILKNGIPDELPPKPKERNPKVPHAPKRLIKLTIEEEKQAIKNALRYFKAEWHSILAIEFKEELDLYGHIYMYRFKPTQYEIKAYPIWVYPTQNKQAATIQIMIMNNLDPKVAQFPDELVVYGGNGSIFSNWAQYLLIMKYLSIVSSYETVSINSGHPVGIFPSNSHSPRAIISNGIVVSNYSKREDYDRMYAMGCTMYGQMTAGSYCYIGPQGIVHGTTLTVMNAGRKYLGSEDLGGKVFVTSGLGGMSGAQAKAGVICGCVAVISEVDGNALKKRFDQGWLSEICEDLEEVIKKIKKYKKEKKGVSIGYHGNTVTLLERLV